MFSNFPINRIPQIIRIQIIPAVVADRVAGEPAANIRVVPAHAAQDGSKGAVGIVPKLAAVAKGVGVTAA